VFHATFAKAKQLVKNRAPWRSSGRTVKWFCGKLSQLELQYEALEKQLTHDFVTLSATSVAVALANVGAHPPPNVRPSSSSSPSAAKDHKSDAFKSMPQCLQMSVLILCVNIFVAFFGFTAVFVGSREWTSLLKTKAKQGVYDIWCLDKSPPAQQLQHKFLNTC